MHTTKQHFSWQDIENDCQTIAKKLTNKKIDLIVAITKGGLSPAVILANKYLGKPHIITLQLEEIQKEGNANYQTREVKVVSELNIYPIKGKHILIIDDVADTGHTLSKAIEIVRRKSPKLVTTAVLHHKPRSIIKPDISALTVPNNIWIVYPWE